MNLRSSLLRKTTVLGSLVVSAVVCHGSAQAQNSVIDLPRQSLSASLRAYARAYGQQIIFTDDLVAGKIAPELHGDYSADAALADLLAGSGLSTRRSPSGAIMVERQVVVPVKAAVVEPQRVDPESEPATEMETVVITGFKRAENVQDVTSSVFVATDKGLERNNVRDFDELGGIAPSLTISKSTQPANNSINIRGVGTYAYSIAAESSSAVVVDDIPQAFQAQAFQAFSDIAQIEVLRGPQSTLFGKSASAGVINITTKAPTEFFSFGAETLVTDDHEYRAQAYVSGPLTDTLKYRLSVNADTYRGNLHNIFNNTWVLGHSDAAATLKVLWEPAENWKVTLSAHGDNTRSSCCTWAYTYVSPGVTFGRFGPGGYQAPQSAILNGVVPSAHNYEISADVNPKGDAVDYGGGLKIERHFGCYTLMSITGYNHYFLHDLQDTDGTAFNWGPGGGNIPGAVVGGSANGGYFHINSLTQEVRLLSPEADRFRYVAGFYVSRTGSVRDYVRGSNTLLPDGSLTTVPANNSPYASYFTRAFDANMAIFAQATYDIFSDLSLIGGVRLNRETKAYQFWDRVNGVAFGVPRCSSQTPTGLSASTCDKADTVSGRAALRYRISPKMMVFVSYDRGYKGKAYDLTSTYTQRTLIAGTNTVLADATAAHQPIPEETVNAYQIGMKSQLFHRMALNVTVFDEIYHGFQAQSRDPVLLQNVLNSIGQVTSKGVEMELAAYVSDHFTLNGAGSFNEVVIDSFPNAACFSSQTPALGCVNNLQDLSGKTLFDAPKWQFNLNGEYSRPLTDTIGVVMNFSYRWQSGVWKNLLHDPESFQDGYGIFNLGAGVEIRRWKLMVFCNNLFDQSYAMTKVRDTTWNITPYGSTVTNATRWTPGRDSSRYLGVRVAVRG